MGRDCEREIFTGRYIIAIDGCGYIAMYSRPPLRSADANWLNECSCAGLVFIALVDQKSVRAGAVADRVVARRVFDGKR